MTTPLERVQNLLADLRMSQVDFDAVFAGKNDLTPLEAVELFVGLDISLDSAKAALESKLTESA